MSKAIAIPECNKEIGCMKEEISISPSEKRDGAIGLFSRLLRLDQLGKKSSIESPTSSTPPTTYYGVYIPCEIKKGPDEEALHVYKNRSEALELVRRYKLARFKAFHNHQDAVSFALRGAEPVDNTDGNDSSLMGEKPYPFKAPSPQDMVSLRKAIEAGITNTVCDRIWDNPRYLVSSGNTPSILQEGSRYNALHVAAKAANAEICNLILTTVGNPMFVQTLYGADADHESCREFAAILVDRYLNTPDKAMNETPLHFAAKFGAEQVVEVLTSFPQCNRDAVNKFGEQAKDIVCKRASKADAACATRIRGMLRDQYYVPVLHAEDDSALPIVGRPFTPARHPELTSSPLCSPLEIRSFAGPMEEGEANSFHRRFKTPPRVPLRPPTFRLQETTKGLEHYGRNLAEELKVGWSEYWPFLDTFTNLRSPEGLALLENYLKSKYEDACSTIFIDSFHIQSQTDNLSLSGISLNATQSPVKDAMSPMSELCVAMKTCTISSDKRLNRSVSCIGALHWRKTDPIRQRLCRQPTAKQTVNGDPSPVMNHTVSPLLCVERTCQVFARRLADALIFSLTAEADVAADSLKSEARHLQHTIYSYLDDERFKAIDFSRIHCRLAQLVAHSLMEHTNNLDDINDLIEFFVKIRCPNDDIFSSDDERKTVNHRGTSKLKLSHVIAGYVRCIAGFLHGELVEAEPRGPTPAPNRLSEYLNVSQVDCVEAWSKASKCRCDWRIDLFERNTKRNSSFRKNRSILSTSPKNDGFIRRLTFDNDIGDGRGACIVPYSAGAEAEVRSSNSPGGDCAPPSPQLPTTPDLSDDESFDEYYTASDNSSGDEDMFDASDRAIADAFIYGEEPSKMDRLVFDALSSVHVSVETYPYVFRWRHTIALYTPEERKKWRAVNGRGDVSVHATLGGGSPMQAHTSTPRRERERKDDARMVPLQVSSWLRVTGPNSPRSALASLNVDHNVSFGF